MKKATIVWISFIMLIASLCGLYFFPDFGGYAVKYVMTDDGPKFKTLETELYDVEEYREGHYYLVDDDGKAYETTAQEWKRSRMFCVLLLSVKLTIIVSVLVFFALGLFPSLFKRFKPTNNSLLPS